MNYFEREFSISIPSNQRKSILHLFPILEFPSTTTTFCRISRRFSIVLRFIRGVYTDTPESFRFSSNLVPHQNIRHSHFALQTKQFLANQLSPFLHLLNHLPSKFQLLVFIMFATSTRSILFLIVFGACTFFASTHAINATTTDSLNFPPNDTVISSTSGGILSTTGTPTPFCGDGNCDISRNGEFNFLLF